MPPTAGNGLGTTFSTALYTNVYGTPGIIPDHEGTPSIIFNSSDDRLKASGAFLK